VLDAYTFIPADAAFLYTVPGAQPPDREALAVAEGEELSRRMQQQEQPQEQQQQQPGAQPQRRLDESGSARQLLHTGAAAEVERPPEGSYAAALLAAFDDKACRAAHTAMWRAKQALMRHNVGVARRVLEEAAALAAAARVAAAVVAS
jgi:hypothetical protein